MRILPAGHLPERTSDTMIDAIALSSPSGRMSKRARKAAEKRLAVALFGPSGMICGERPKQTVEQKRARMLDYAKELRGLAARGLQPRKLVREAERLEMEASKL